MKGDVARDARWPASPRGPLDASRSAASLAKRRVRTFAGLIAANLRASEEQQETTAPPPSWQAHARRRRAACTAILRTHLRDPDDRASRD